MFHSQAIWRRLADALIPDYEGGDLFGDVLEPWLQEHAGECGWLREAAARPFDGTPRVGREDETCLLYAAFRVASVLLLPFQPNRISSYSWPGPPTTLEGYVLFFEQLGFRVARETAFHPFYHEIVEVEPAPDPAEPIRVVRELWPALMLGEMMFVRAGCVVSGGRNHVVREIAENSRLFWTFRRRDRRCLDASHGWGSNSQWRTGLRRDYRNAAGFHYNVDATTSLDQAAADPQDPVPPDLLRELVRHRGLIRTPAERDWEPFYCFHDFEPAPRP